MHAISILEYDQEWKRLSTLNLHPNQYANQFGIGKSTTCRLIKYLDSSYGYLVVSLLFSASFLPLVLWHSIGFLRRFLGLKLSRIGFYSIQRLLWLHSCLL